MIYNATFETAAIRGDGFYRATLPNNKLHRSKRCQTTLKSSCTIIFHQFPNMHWRFINFTIHPRGYFLIFNRQHISLSLPCISQLRIIHTLVHDWVRRWGVASSCSRADLIRNIEQNRTVSDPLGHHGIMVYDTPPPHDANLNSNIHTCNNLTACCDNFDLDYAFGDRFLPIFKKHIILSTSLYDQHFAIQRIDLVRDMRFSDSQQSQYHHHMNKNNGSGYIYSFSAFPGFGQRHFNLYNIVAYEKLHVMNIRLISMFSDLKKPYFRRFCTQQLTKLIVTVNDRFVGMIPSTRIPPIRPFCLNS